MNEEKLWMNSPGQIVKESLEPLSKLVRQQKKILLANPEYQKFVNLEEKLRRRWEGNTAEGIWERRYREFHRHHSPKVLFDKYTSSKNGDWDHVIFKEYLDTEGKPSKVYSLNSEWRYIAMAGNYNTIKTLSYFRFEEGFRQKDIIENLERQLENGRLSTNELELKKMIREISRGEG